MATPSAQLQRYDSMLPYKRIEFTTHDSTILRGNLYHAKTSRKAPIVIFVHGLGLLKEQYLENWFRHFIQAGYHVLSYDNRSFGDSDGLPRNCFNWMQQAEDFVDAVSYVSQLVEVDDTKICGWGVAHAGGLIAMAAAMDKRIAGIIMFLPSIDGAWDKKAWGEATWEAAKRHRYQGKLQDAESIRFWPLTDAEAAGTGGSVLSGAYVREWSVVAQKMAEQGGNMAFTGHLTLASFWSDYHTRPLDFFDKIAAPVLWVMASDDVVCGPLDFTRGVYDKLQCPKEMCVLEGEHLAQYFDPGFPIGLEAMLSFMKIYAS